MTRKVVTESARLSDTLLQATDHGLLALGEIASESVYNRIEKTHGVRREEIPQKLDIFHKALVDLLGAGASVVEKLIAKNLYSRLGLNLDTMRTGHWLHTLIMRGRLSCTAFLRQEFTNGFGAE